MDKFFENVLNDDLNYYIFKLLHKTQLNEVFNELFEKIKYIDVLQEIVEDYDCNYYITLNEELKNYYKESFENQTFYPEPKVNTIQL